MFTEIGYNYKLSDIAAAILQVQLGRIGELLDRRRAIAAHYGELLAGEELVTLPHVPADRTHAWQSYLVTLDPRVDRAALAADLRAQGIGCGHGTWATHLQPVYESKQTCPVSADLFNAPGHPHARRTHPGAGRAGRGKPAHRAARMIRMSFDPMRRRPV